MINLFGRLEVMKMYQAEREQRILDYLSEARIASPAQLQAITSASIATVRRDLSEMAQKGLIQRSHGYVQLSETPVRFTPNYLDEKMYIARIAAEQVQDGDVIFLGSGTTCTCFAHCLSGKRNLTIMTINLDVVQDLVNLPGAKLSLLGGEVRVEPGYMETLDEYTMQILKRLFFDKVFVTVDAIDFAFGYSIRKQLQLSLFQHLLRNSREFYCLADASKFEKCTHVQLCQIEDVKNIITTEDVSTKYASKFAELGIRVISK